MAMRTESIAVMLAISKTDSEALMKTEAFASELAYEVSRSILFSLLKQNIIDKKEFVRLDQALIERYHPGLGALFTCYFSSLE